MADTASPASRFRTDLVRRWAKWTVVVGTLWAAWAVYILATTEMWWHAAE